jgi:hypothetical protein
MISTCITKRIDNRNYFIWFSDPWKTTAAFWKKISVTVFHIVQWITLSLLFYSEYILGNWHSIWTPRPLQPKLIKIFRKITQPTGNCVFHSAMPRCRHWSHDILYTPDNRIGLYNVLRAVNSAKKSISVCNPNRSLKRRTTRLYKPQKCDSHFPSFSQVSRDWQ